MQRTDERRRAGDRLIRRVTRVVAVAAVGGLAVVFGAIETTQGAKATKVAYTTARHAAAAKKTTVTTTTVTATSAAPVASSGGS